ncbi:DJ-1/PfpI family protein [Nocardia transvalensis]|uniref:DJ-1/PfpI family protein n=1 Tax=Nocardia transvalensis TaxID=37333 RepID=UPI001895F5E7|nr:DJ-1/PfpI family protein [Nocardia transvalensis]MBF6329527.1 DJ-1/PfpI family protein [Nocardia transvalensis]
MYVQFALFDGFALLDVVAPYEALYAAGLATEGGVSVELVTAEGAREVTSGIASVSLRATAALDPERADVIVVPGGVGLPSDDTADPDHNLVAILARAAGTGLSPLLSQALERGDTLVATVCGGSMILAMAGLLAGRPATTHHLGMEALAAAGATAVHARVVDDGNLVSGAGVTSGLDVALHVIEREIGPQVAHAVETLFAHERRGVVWSRRGPVPSFTG